MQTDDDEVMVLPDGLVEVEVKEGKIEEVEEVEKEEEEEDRVECPRYTEASRTGH